MPDVNTAKLNHSPAFEALCDDARTRVSEISIDAVEKLLASQEKFSLIDVRDAGEFESYRIEQAMHLSKGWIEAKIHTITDNKNDLLILYCGGGNRSLLAADNLQKMGYQNVKSMTGGIKAWVNSANPYQN